MYDPKTPIGKSRKLIRRWTGPYFIIRQTGLSNYTLAHCETKKEIPYAVNVDRIKPFNDQRDVFHSYEDASQVFQTAVTDDANQDDIDNAVDIQQSATATNDQVITDILVSDSSKSELGKQITGVKTIDNVRHYRIVWEDLNQEPSWIPEKDIPEILKTEYHITHTLRGTRRQNYGRFK